MPDSMGKQHQENDNAQCYWGHFILLLWVDRKCPSHYKRRLVGLKRFGYNFNQHAVDETALGYQGISIPFTDD
jgi:hypothetical protein